MKLVLFVILAFLVQLDTAKKCWEGDPKPLPVPSQNTAFTLIGVFAVIILFVAIMIISSCCCTEDKSTSKKVPPRKVLARKSPHPVSGIHKPVYTIPQSQNPVNAPSALNLPKAPPPIYNRPPPSAPVFPGTPGPMPYYRPRV